MSDMQKKQNFLQGTALLAMATAIVKVIGADLHLSGFATGVYYGLKSFFFV